MASTPHTHGNEAPHEHGDAYPGHTHDSTQPVREETVVEERPGGGFAGRMIFGVIGAAGMIVGPFLTWAEGQRGTEIEFKAFVSSEIGGNGGFVASAGFVLLVLGVVALIGLLFRSGWLTSLAAGLGLIGTVLIAVGQFRDGEGFASLGLGWWIAAIGSLLALIASMFATRTRVVETRARTV